MSRPGLYKLIQRSNEPEAKEFGRWIRHEVVPQIMDNDGYVAPGRPDRRRQSTAPYCRESEWAASVAKLTAALLSLSG